MEWILCSDVLIIVSDYLADTVLQLDDDMAKLAARLTLTFTCYK